MPCNAPRPSPYLHAPHELPCPPCSGPAPHPSPYHQSPQPPCPQRCEPVLSHCAPRPHSLSSYRGYSTCRTQAVCLPKTCPSVKPPKGPVEYVVFRKRYVCSMKDHCKPCEKDCPYIRTIQYIVEPVWEQVCCQNQEQTLDELFGGQEGCEVGKSTDMGHCLACAFPECHLEEDEGSYCGEDP